ncbi:WD repeat domain phosphoinositide-interacting protein 4-like isoform X2 [Varroa destructor]|uniref:WD repeat domain phosphoinositide-interacting protein 4 n=1 Tax=Varroa destructor TaxID=109461 RepID=A0A7M7JC30_VARDE|nr:WD repeat domain phosphoinositide-interacting protein 4-like isoform X2 [Varroa destructor]
MNSNKKVYSLRFNQDQSLFACASDNGIQIFNIEPLSEVEHITDHPDLPPIGKVEMLHRSNFLALIPDGSGNCADNVVLGYDLNKHSVCMDSAFIGKVLSVRLRRDKMVVVRSRQISVFSFPGIPKVLHVRDTRPNPKGLCELSPLATSQRIILAYPGQKIGSAMIEDLSSSPPHSITINAHQNELECIALNQSGTMLATASQKGTLIRVFDTARSSAQLYEFRRGNDPATMYCINFSPDDRRSIKPFDFASFASFATDVRALASFKVKAECACMCAFGPQTERGQIVYAVCVDGTFHKYIFSETTRASLEAFDCFFDVCPHDKQELC